MVVNYGTRFLDDRGALRFFASKLAPTGFRVGRKICGRSITPVGASLLAMVVNNGARFLDKRGALGFFASRLAPTG
jgi:hypothetical protein